MKVTQLTGGTKEREHSCKHASSEAVCSQGTCSIKRIRFNQECVHSREYQDHATTLSALTLHRSFLDPPAAEERASDNWNNPMDRGI